MIAGKVVPVYPIFAFVWDKPLDHSPEATRR